MLNRLKIFILVCYLGLASNLLTGCKTAADASSSILSQSRPKSGALTAPQLGAFPIGWQPNGKQLSLALPRSNFNCSYRLGPVYPTTGSQGVDSMSYSPCSLNSQGSLPLTMPRSGQQDGTFRIDVSFDSGSTNEISQSFYVHPSLNGPTACPQLSPSTVNQIFLTAANYLDTSLHFGPSTSLQSPFVALDFPAIPASPATAYLFGDTPDTPATGSTQTSVHTTSSLNYVYSLRKRFQRNSDSTLIFFQRTWSPNQGNTCKLGVLGNYLYYLRPASSPTVLTSFLTGLYLVNPVNKTLIIPSGLSNCVAAVFNALGRGVCFDSSIFSNKTSKPVGFFTGLRKKTALSSHNIVSGKNRITGGVSTGMGRMSDVAATTHSSFINLDE